MAFNILASLGSKILSEEGTEAAVSKTKANPRKSGGSIGTSAPALAQSIGAALAGNSGEGQAPLLRVLGSHRFEASAGSPTIRRVKKRA